MGSQRALASTTIDKTDACPHWYLSSTCKLHRQERKIKGELLHWLASLQAFSTEDEPHHHVADRLVQNWVC